MSAQGETLVRMRGVSKVYRTETVETHALSEIDLDIRAGEYLALTGKSGSGKSTLLSVIGLLETSSGGIYELAGRSVTNIDRAERARLRCGHIGFVFQFFHLIGDLSVEDNIALPMAYAGRAGRDIRERVGVLAERLQISHRLGHRPSQLSGGQQQRVAIARALANDPALLMLDEPTGNLDEESGAQVMRLIAEMHAEGRTVCLVTHDLTYAADATRRLEMRDGKLLPAEMALANKEA